MTEDQQQPLLSHEGRIVIRNIPFDLKTTHIQKAFNKFGKVQQVDVPMKMENGLNRGFAFVEFSTPEEAKTAITGMNGIKYKGRLISVEFSMSKPKYEKKI